MFACNGLAVFKWVTLFMFGLFMFHTGKCGCNCKYVHHRQKGTRPIARPLFGINQGHYVVKFNSAQSERTVYRDP